MAGRKYTDTERRRALDLYVLHGPCRASKETGIPKGTIGMWAKKAGLETKSLERMQEANEAREARIVAKRSQLKELLISKAVDLAKRMDEPHIDFKGKDVDEVTYPKAPAAACQNYATSIGILIDKFRLENGEVTGRQEHSGPNGAPLVTSIVVELPAAPTEEAPDGTLDDQRAGGAEA